MNLIIIKKIYFTLQKMFIGRSFAHWGKNTGIRWRFRFIGKKNISIGSNVIIGPGCTLATYESYGGGAYTPNLSIGDNVSITSKFTCHCAGKVRISKDVLIASNVFITDNNHGMNPTKGRYVDQPLSRGNVLIGRGCWIGEQCCILPGARVGEYSIIGANSVVCGEIPPYCIAVGSPAKAIKRWDSSCETWTRIGDNN